MPHSPFFERWIVSWYAGVPAAQVAAAEGCPVGEVRRARTRAGRGAEHGHRLSDQTMARRRLRGGHQLTLAEATIPGPAR